MLRLSEVPCNVTVNMVLSNDIVTNRPLYSESKIPLNNPISWSLLFIHFCHQIQDEINFSINSNLKFGFRAEIFVFNVFTKY